ncbi:MAG: alpha-glucosidase family protein [Pseudomonadota bacterium]
MRGSPTLTSADSDWWKGAVIYQVYPRSFQDSDGDGVGDLAGLARRLPYIADLGVDAIWLSPVFLSPMKDFGYDVADYQAIDPLFGSLSDFDIMMSKARELGLKVIIDLVFSHSSDQHPWFRESQQDRTNPKAGWYVWADAKADGSPPNNWQSVFGGDAWQWYEPRGQYYLHNFLKEQPDLNLHNIEVQDALLSVLRFWLERGVHGVRLDVVNFYFHDEALRDNPKLPANSAVSAPTEAVSAYDWQDHIYDKNRPETVGFLRRMRDTLNDYPMTTSIGEISDTQYGMPLRVDYTADGDKLHMCYEFSLLSEQYPGARGLHSLIAQYESTIGDGWACWAHSNHDVSRIASRWELDEAGQKLHAALLMSLRGTACLYQGEELGLTESSVAFEDLQDPFGKHFWPDYKGRDGCRTPMVWDSDQPHAEFADAKPWLPIDPHHMPKAVSVQDEDETSLLSFYRAFIGYRAERPALIQGSLDLLPGDDAVFAFVRSLGGEQVLCAFNLSSDEAQISLPPGLWTADDASPFDSHLSDGVGFLKPHDALYANNKNPN